MQKSGYLISSSTVKIDTCAEISAQEALDWLADFKNRSRQQQSQTVALIKGRLGDYEKQPAPATVYAAHRTTNTRT